MKCKTCGGRGWTCKKCDEFGYPHKGVCDCFQEPTPDAPHTYRDADPFPTCPDCNGEGEEITSEEIAMTRFPPQVSAHDPSPSAGPGSERTLVPMWGDGKIDFNMADETVSMSLDTWNDMCADLLRAGIANLCGDTTTHPLTDEEREHLERIGRLLSIGTHGEISSFDQGWLYGIATRLVRENERLQRDYDGAWKLACDGVRDVYDKVEADRNRLREAALALADKADAIHGSLWSRYTDAVREAAGALEGEDDG